MTHRESITAILEWYFVGFKKEIIDSACNRILEQEPSEDKAYLKGYEDGYKDGKSVVELPEIDKKYISDTYNKGLNDAWEVVKKLVDMSDKDIEKCFDVVALNTNGFKGILHHNSVSEVIEKIKEYEEKQKQDDEIKVGDEIVSGDSHVVVTYISPKGEWNGFLLNNTRYGEQGQGYTCVIDFKGWQKTGEHFPQIAEMFEQMKKRDNQ